MAVKRMIDPRSICQIEVGMMMRAAFIITVAIVSQSEGTMILSQSYKKKQE